MKTLVNFIKENNINESININSIVDKIKSLGPNESMYFLYGVIYNYGKKTELFPDTMELVSIWKDKKERYYCVPNIIISDYVHKALANLSKKAPKEVNIKGPNFLRASTSFDETAIEYILTNLPKEIQSLLQDNSYVKYVSLDLEECYDYSKKYVKEVKPIKFKENIRNIDNQIRSLEEQIKNLKETKKMIEEIMA